MNDDAVHITELRKNYGKFEALRGLNLTVPRGQIFGLLGANGAGKTTLIKVLIGLGRYHSGQVSVLGLNPQTQARSLRRQIGYMPQESALYEDLSARDNVRFFGRAHAIQNLEARIDQILEFVNLRERQHEAVHRFSGGMKQRVSLACALVHQPTLMLLDEPTAGIDPKLRETLWMHFRTLAAQGVTIIVSTHQMDEALHCDHIAVMREGVVLASDTPRGLLGRGTAHIKIWNGAQVVDETLAQYPEELPRLLQRFHLDPTVSRIEVVEDTLEDIILNLINGKVPAAS
ncbi:MAG: ABC transporter ATP-binding protein [Chloroflexi bacterium]|nr:ABC transporter ATP-binding protein [Chloroflexota bacterium]